MAWQRRSATGWPAPPAFAAQIVSRAAMPNMLAKLYSGQSIKTEGASSRPVRKIVVLDG